jgi:hypothetical protein
MALRALQGPTGGGSPVGGGGTSSPSTIPRWTGPSTLGDSVITQSGSFIGIGTVSPGARLHVSDNSSIPVIVQSSGSTDSYLRFINTSNNLGYIGYVGTNLYLAPNNGAGNVGIGTASPGAQFQVERAGGTVANAEYIRLRNVTNGTGSNVTIGMYVANNTVGTGYISHVNAAGPSYDTTFSNWNGSTAAEVMRIVGSTGNVGIGTPSPTTFAASGSVVLGQNVTSQQWALKIFGGNDANRAPVLSLFRAGNTEGIIAEIKNGAVGALALGITGGVANFNDATLSAACQVQITSTLLDISGTNYGLKLPATPGNADAQTLDCYQENPLATTAGNGWTPTLSAAATWGGTQPTVDYARYIRIGSMVFCEVRLSGAALTATYGTTTISQPPVTINATAIESAVPVSTAAGSGVGVCTSTSVFLPTLGATTAMRLSWFYFTTS